MGGQLGPRTIEFGHQLDDPRAQGVDMRLELDDALDAGQVDAVLLGQALHLAQQSDITCRVPASAAPGTTRGHQPEPVVLAQRLRVHAGELGRHRDDEHRRVVGHVLRPEHVHLPTTAPPGRARR